MKPIEVTEFTTFYKIPKLEKMSYANLKKNFSIENYYTKDLEPYGYEEESNHFKCMKIQKGLLTSLLVGNGLIPKYKDGGVFPYGAIKKFEMKNPPKDEEQANVINSVFRKFSEGDNRAIVSLKTGKGKTYVATNLIHRLGVKTIIMVKSVKLRMQWIDSFRTHTTCKSIKAIESGRDLLNLLDDSGMEYDIIVCLHSTMRSFINEYGIKSFSKLLLKNKIGMKVFDEFDLENGSMFRMDMHSSCKFNLYLSATDYKSSKKEDVVFQKIFGHVYNIGKEYAHSLERKGKFYIFAVPVSRELRNKVYGYTPNGLEFSYPKFHKYCVENMPSKPIILHLWETFIKERFKKGLKTLFFIGRKTTADSFKKKLAELFNIPLQDIGIVNSDIPKDRINYNASKKIIVSTSNSMGRGVDIKGLDTIVDLETRASRSNTSQVIGRVSRTGMENIGTYIQIVDATFDIPVRNFWSKENKGFFDDFFSDKEIIELSSFDELEN